MILEGSDADQLQLFDKCGDEFMVSVVHRSISGTVPHFVERNIRWIELANFHDALVLVRAHSGLAELQGGVWLSLGGRRRIGGTM